MLRFQHRLSKDIDFFGYDAQWLSVFSPRLSQVAANLATAYTEQANTVKIVMPEGDIDFIIAADVAMPVERISQVIAGRRLLLDPTSEILAKKLYYRAATLKPRDVYDMSAAIDLDRPSAIVAVQAAISKQDILLRRLEQLASADPQTLLNDIMPYDGALSHTAGMIAKLRDAILQVGKLRETGAQK